MQHEARVLIVDDSLIMRALFNGVFDAAKGVRVVGLAASAAEARRMIADVRPNVITLDVEMPGMNGLEFLEEIMQGEKPLPVIMLSALTQRGAETSFKALELGAVDCFPKPTAPASGEFEKLIALVRAAANRGARPARHATGQPTRIHAPHVGYEWNGKIILMSASTGGVDAMLQLLPSFPANCPPTVICLGIDPNFVDPLLARLRVTCSAKVVLAEDRQPLRQGVIQLVTDPGLHAVIDRWPDPTLGLRRSDPINGTRPSASLLFATAAKTAGPHAVATVLTGLGSDGAAGLKAVKAAGGSTFAQDSESAVLDEAPAAARAAGAVERALPLNEIAAALLDQCRRVSEAA